MSEIRFNRWSHQSGTGGIYQDSSGNIGIGTSVPTSVLDIQGGSIKIGNDLLTSSGVSTFTSGLNVTSGGITVTNGDISVSDSTAEVSITSNGGSSNAARLNVTGASGGNAEIYLSADAAANSADNVVIKQENGGPLKINVNNGSVNVVSITSGGNVGIGTDNPPAKLSVDGSVIFGNTTSSGLGGTLRIVESGNSVYIQPGSNTSNDSSCDLIISSTNGVTEKLRITSTGNVGLGVSPESWGTNFRAFQIGSTGSLASQVGARTIELATNAYNNSGWKYTDSDVASLYYQYNGEHIFSNAPSGTDDASISFAERLRIGSNGGVSISNAGTFPTSTNETLNIQGQGHNGHGTTNTRSVVSVIGAITDNANAAGLWIGARTNENTAVIGTRTGTGNLAIETYNSGWAERFRIDNVGRVTMPYQPCFLAYGNTSQTLNTNTSAVKIQFTGTPFINVGSYFDTSNSNFNAPVSGKYFIFASVMLSSNFTNYTYLFMDFAVNDTRLSREMMLPRPSGADYVSIQGSMIVNVSAGDSIQVYLIQSGGTAAGVRSAFRHFGGYLIG